MNKKLCTRLLQAIVVLSFPLLASAQWKPIAAVYGGAIGNDGAVSFSAGGKGYLLAGSSTSAVYSYDTLTKKWSKGGNIPPTMGHAFAMSFMINGKAYIVGGDSSGVPVSSVWEFDPAATANPWMQKKDFPGGKRDAGFGFALGNDGYVGAGFDGGYIYNDIWKYDASNDSWSQLSLSLPISGVIFPCSFVIANKAYILTGGTAPSGLNEISSMWCFDPVAGTISSKADVPGEGRQAAFAFSNDSYGFVGGGQSSYTTNYNDMWRYNPAEDKWYEAPKAPLLGAAWSSTFVIANTAYVGLGAKFVGTSLTGNDVFYTYAMNSSITSTEDTPQESAAYSLYPNPATNDVYIHGDEGEELHIEVYTLLGERIMSRDIQAKQRFSIAHLAPGMYSLTIRSDKHNSVMRILQRAQ